MTKVKVIIVGNGQVGKTCLICQFLDSNFQLEYQMTTAPDKSIKTVQVLNKEITFEIWDTAGQESYAAANKIFMKKADIALIVYDITEKKSFENLKNWYNRVVEINDKRKVIFGIAGNKSDLFENQVISTEEGKQFSKTIGASFFETSAKDHYSVNKAFMGLAEEYVRQNLEKQKEEEKIGIEEKNGEEDKKENIIVLDQSRHTETVINQGKKKKKC